MYILEMSSSADKQMVKNVVNDALRQMVQGKDSEKKKGV